MAVRLDPSGHRSVWVKVQVPAPTEEVWAAIATADGISAWFAPTTFQSGSDGTPNRITFRFAPDSTDAVMVTAWEPPRRFVVESSDFIPGGPSVTTEWNLHQARDGGCVVRVEHQMIADTDDWDLYLEGAEAGWPAFFKNLKSLLVLNQRLPGSPA